MIAVGRTRVKDIPIGTNRVDYAFVGDKLVHPQMLMRRSAAATSYVGASGGYQQCGLSADNVKGYCDSMSNSFNWGIGTFGGWSYFYSWGSNVSGILHYRGDIRTVPTGLAGNVTMAWGNLGGTSASPLFAPVDGPTKPVLAISDAWTAYEWNVYVTIHVGGMWSLGISGWYGHLEERNVSLTFSAD